MKKVLMGCGGCLVLVVGALFALYYMATDLPREHRASSAIEVAATPEELWPLVSDLEGQADWCAMIHSVSVSETADGQKLYTQVGDMGPMPLLITASEEPSRFKTEIQGDDLGWGGTWEWTVEPTDGGSRVSIVEEGWVENPMLRFLSHRVMGLHYGMDQMLTLLAAEVGSPGEPTHVE